MVIIFNYNDAYLFLETNFDQKSELLQFWIVLKMVYLCGCMKDLLIGSSMTIHKTPSVLIRMFTNARITITLYLVK